MKREEPGPSLPAWLRDDPPAGPGDTARRGFRRSGRVSDSEDPSPPASRPSVEFTGNPTSSVPIVPESAPVASMPLGMVLLPAPTPQEPPVFVTPSAGPEPAPEPAPAVPDEPTPPIVNAPVESHGSLPAGETPATPEAPRIAEPPEIAEAPESAGTPGNAEPLPPRSAPPTAEPLEIPPAATDRPSVQIDLPYTEPDSSPLPAPVHHPSDLDLASGVLVRRSRRSSRRWREGVGKITGGLLDGRRAERHEELVARIRQPISGDYRIAVLSLKGGVGKTTTTVGLGSTFASLRGDCVVAVDANPDFGTLAQRIPQQTRSTVRDLLADAPNIRRYSDVRTHTSQAPSRLEVLAGERDPAASEAFSEDDYRRVIDILQVFYNIILTDCGTGIMHSAMRGVLATANALVLVASPAVDAARSAAATLDWLQAHGYGELVEQTVVVVSSPRPGAANIDMDALIEHFLARCRAVQVLPFDEHLAEGAEIHLDRLRPATRHAFVELAAMVADDFPVLSGRHAVR